MALSRDLTVKLLADTTDLAKGLKSTDGSMGKLGGTVGKLAGGFAALGGAAVAIDFLGDATKAAEEDKKSQALLANQLRETNKATDEQIATVEASLDALSRASGVADDELRPAYAALARSTGDTEEANRQLALAMDIAAGRGVPLETVTKAMEKANMGNVTALGKLGVATKDAAGETLTLEQIMGKASETYKGAAEAAVTPGEKMNIAFTELKESIGAALLPALENLSTFMVETVLPAFENAIVWIKENWPAIENAIEKMWAIVGPILENMFKYLKIQFDVISGIIKTFTALLHGDFSGAWKAVQETVGKVWEGITGIIENQVTIIKETFGGLIEWLGSLPYKIGRAVGGMWDGIYNAFKGALNKIIQAWNGLDFEIPGFSIGPVSWSGFTLGLPHVNELAKGGIVRSPTLALIGEKGPEAVVPLSRGGGMGGVINVAVANIYPANMSEEAVVAAFNNWARRNGGVRVPGGVTAVA